MNLRAGLRSEDGRWELAAWVRNLTDESYYAQSTTQPLNAFVSGGGTGDNIVLAGLGADRVNQPPLAGTDPAPGNSGIAPPFTPPTLL